MLALFLTLFPVCCLLDHYSLSIRQCSEAIKVTYVILYGLLAYNLLQIGSISLCEVGNRKFGINPPIFMPVFMISKIKSRLHCGQSFSSMIT